MYLKKIQQLIVSRTGIDPHEIEPTSHFQDDLNIGELEFMELVEELEGVYDVEIAELVSEVETVEDLITILSEELE